MKIGAYEFPFEFSDANRAYFTGMARIKAAKARRKSPSAMNAFLKDAGDAQALALVAGKDPSWNATLRRPALHHARCRPRDERIGHSVARQRQLRIFPGTSPETGKRSSKNWRRIPR